tara:strand:- start:1819 stop:2838 length:1020 start_codon:yes stop_codon:yes gene_type:complete
MKLSNNITNLDELCIYNIIYFINNDFETIVNFANTCKEYRNNLSFYILSFNSIYITTYTNFENAIRKSYYDISDLKFINNNKSNNTIPIPCYNNISNKSIEFTIDIYNHFFRINNCNNGTIYKYYDKLFDLKFNIDSKYNFYKTKYNIELDYFMSFFDYSILKTIKYDNNCVIDYDFKSYQYGIQNYTKKFKNYRITNSNFNLYCIFRIIKTKKYNMLIQNINNIVFWQSSPYRLTDIVLGQIQIYIINDKINANDKLLRTIIILIYLKYIIAITKVKSKNDIINIMRGKPIKIYNLFNDYYKNLNYEFKPKYLNKYINQEYINYINKLYNLYKLLHII